MQTDLARIEAAADLLLTNVGVGSSTELEFDGDTPRAGDADAVKVLEQLHCVMEPARLMADLAKAYRYGVVSYRPWFAPPEGIEDDRWAEMWDDMGFVYVAEREEVETMFAQTGWHVVMSVNAPLHNTDRVVWLLKSSAFADAKRAA